MEIYSGNMYSVLLDDSDDSEIETTPVLDLHGYFLKEAIQELRLFLKTYSEGEEQYLIIITGKGLHSAYGPVIKPEVKKRLTEWGYTFEQDAYNSGRLIVENKYLTVRGANNRNRQFSYRFSSDNEDEYLFSNDVSFQWQTTVPRRDSQTIPAVRNQCDTAASHQLPITSHSKSKLSVKETRQKKKDQKQSMDHTLFERAGYPRRRRRWPRRRSSKPAIPNIPARNLWPLLHLKIITAYFQKVITLGNLIGTLGNLIGTLGNLIGTLGNRILILILTIGKLILMALFNCTFPLIQLYFNTYRAYIQKNRSIDSEMERLKGQNRRMRGNPIDHRIMDGMGIPGLDMVRAVLQILKLVVKWLVIAVGMCLLFIALLTMFLDNNKEVYQTPAAEEMLFCMRVESDGCNEEPVYVLVRKTAIDELEIVI